MTRRTPLYEIHRQQGARFADYSGWELPNQFQSLNQDYDVLRSHGALLDLSSSGILEVTGKDRARFLHGVLTNDINSLQSGQGCYAALLTPQGRIVADVQLYCLRESLLLTTDTVLKEKLPACLRKYLIGNQAEVLDRSDLLGLISVQGLRAPGFLEGLGLIPLPTKDFQHLEGKLLGAEVRVCRMKRTAYEGFDLLVPRESLVEFWRFLTEQGKSLGILPVGMEALNVHRIEAGIPQYGKDMDESNILVEAGLQSAVSFTKGCYIGQEIVARATFVGQVNRRLTGLVVSGDFCPAARSRIFLEEKEVGWITSSTFSPELKTCIALGYLRREAMEPNTEVLVKESDQIMKCTVTPLPFVQS
jgi:glycine cleavage system T protein